MTTLTPHPVTAARGLPENSLPASLLDRLPPTAPPAPWATRCEVLTWWHRPRRDTADLLPLALRGRGVAVVAWALVRYAETPVGPYDEVAVAVIPRGRGPAHIPFICVDSLPSIVGGRVNWLLPKSLARFDRSDGGRSVEVRPVEPAEPAWWLRVNGRPVGPPVPLPMPVRFSVAQADGSDADTHRFLGRSRGVGRYTRVAVEGVADGPLGSLLRTGRHHGMSLTHGRFIAGPLMPG